MTRPKYKGKKKEKQRKERKDPDPDPDPYKGATKETTKETTKESANECGAYWVLTVWENPRQSVEAGEGLPDPPQPGPQSVHPTGGAQVRPYGAAICLVVGIQVAAPHGQHKPDIGPRGRLSLRSRLSLINRHRHD